MLYLSTFVGSSKKGGEVDLNGDSEQKTNSDSSERVHECINSLVLHVNEAAVVWIQRENVSQTDGERSQQPR